MTCETETVTLEGVTAAIRDATNEVFSVMLGIDIEPGTAEPTGAGAAHSGVLAVLGLTGAWGGSGEVACETALSIEIARRLLMSECTTVDDEVLDAIAEVGNMIVGNVKTYLEHLLGPMGLSTPAVFFGGDFETRVAGRSLKVLLPFRCPIGALTVQVSIAPRAASRLRPRV